MQATIYAAEIDFHAQICIFTFFPSFILSLFFYLFRGECLWKII